RVHPTGTAVLGVSCQTQGQGHETTFAQIVAHELGLSPDDIEVVHGDTDRTPFGLGTYGSRSTPVSGAAAAMVARKVPERPAGGAGWSPRPCSRSHRGTWGGRRAGGGSGATRTRPRASSRSRWRPTRPWNCPPAWRATSTRRPSTTRRTSPSRSAPTSASPTW